MDIRSALEKNNKIAAIGAALLLVVGVSAVAVQWSGMSETPNGSVYYTDDDGKTFFIGSGSETPPFSHDGKLACKAHVFEVGGQRVVGYMSRYSEAALAVIRTATAAKQAGQPVPNVGQLSQVGLTGVEIKRPGDKQWINQGSGNPQLVNKIRVFKTSSGETPPEVYP